MSILLLAQRMGKFVLAFEHLLNEPHLKLAIMPMALPSQLYRWLVCFPYEYTGVYNILKDAVHLKWV